MVEKGRRTLPELYLPKGVGMCQLLSVLDRGLLIRALIGLTVAWAVVAGGQHAHGEEPSADLSGSWRGRLESRAFLFAMQLNIERAGPRWKGQGILSTEGKEQSHPLRDLEIAGDKVSFVMEIEGAGELRFRGSLNASRMLGAAEASSGDLAEIVGSSGWEVSHATEQESHPGPAVTTVEQMDKKAVEELPRPTGPYAVGRMSMFWTDTSRADVLAENSQDRRELMVQVWYPAETREQGPFAPYVPDADAIIESRGDSDVPLARAIRTNAVERAAVAAAPQRFPVLIFSHGFGVKCVFYSALLEELTSHGYVVAAIEHTYDTSAVVFPDGRLIKFPWAKYKQVKASEEGVIRYTGERMQVWASDEIFVLDELTKLNGGTPASVLADRLDLSRVGVFGHSLGGLAGAQACERDRRFRVCVNMDGMTNLQAYVPDQAGHGPPVPFLYMSRRVMMTDPELAIMGVTRGQYDEIERKHTRAMFASLEKLPVKSAVALLANTGHVSFSDLPLFSPKVMSETLDARLITAQTVRDIVRQFFDSHLKDDAGGRWPIERPELLIEQFDPSS